MRQAEIEEVRQNLRAEREDLRAKITSMSVTLFTTRAKREFEALVRKMEEVDRALTVFERQVVYVKNI